MKCFLLAIVSLVGAARADADGQGWADPMEPLLVDITQVLGTASLFSQSEYDGREATVLVSQITPTIPADTNIECTLTCTDTFETVVLNMMFGAPPEDVINDGTRRFRGRCPVKNTVYTGDSAQTLYVSVAQDGGPMLDGSVVCVDAGTPTPTQSPTITLAPIPAGAGSGICFSEEATVHVQGKGTVEMKDLQVNDKVWVGNQGRASLYESIYAFGHYQPEKATEYLKLYTQSSSLEISAAHLLYLAGKEDPVRADTVQPGDVLLQKSLDATATTSVHVTKVDQIIRKGAYMPLTKSGSIVVNGYHVSAYVSISDDAPRIVSGFQRIYLSEQTLLHWWLAPYRMVCLGISSKLCENDYNEEEGIAYWLVLGRHIARVGDKWSPGFQLIGLAVFALFMATCMALEAFLEHLWIFSAVCMLVVVATRRGPGISLRKRTKSRMRGFPLALFPLAFLGLARADQDVPGQGWADPKEPLLVDITQALGTASLFSQSEYDGREATVLVSQITPTILANSNIECTLTCTDTTFDSVVLNMMYGAPPEDVTEDGTRFFSTTCPVKLSIDTFDSAQTLYVSVAQDGGPMLDGSVVCNPLGDPTPPPTPAPTLAPTPSPPGICFSGEATVQVQGKGTVELKDLQVNDKVWVGNQGNTSLYESVYAFGHYQPEKDTKYLKLYTQSSSLEISAAHLLYVVGKEDPVRADTVQPGDVLLHENLVVTTTASAVVTKVHKVIRKGAYMPLTKSGSLVVNEYHASAYVSIWDDAPRIVSRLRIFLSEQTLLHWWLAPYRMVCLGISSKLCENDYNEEEGIAYWLVLGRHIARVGDKWSPGFQLIGLAVFALFSAMCMVMEMFLEHLWIFSATCMLVVVARRRGGSVSLRKTKMD